MTENSLLVCSVKISTESRQYARPDRVSENVLLFITKVCDAFFFSFFFFLKLTTFHPLREAKRPTPLLPSAPLNLFSFFWLTGDYGRALTQGVQARKMRC